MPTPPDDEALRVVKDDKPRPRLFQENIPEAELGNVRSTAERESPVRLHRIGVTIGFVVLLAILAAGVAYWIERHRYPVVVAIELPDKKTTEDVPADSNRGFIPVRPDTLQVTTISLGTPRLAIVNGREMTEGETIVLKTTFGRASLRVISIQDGMVRFKHGGQTIDVPLTAQKNPR